jgi:hypothetical protein
MEQLLDFENENFKNKVYKLNKALYGLKQASKSWYENLGIFSHHGHTKILTTYIDVDWGGCLKD